MRWMLHRLGTNAFCPVFVKFQERSYDGCLSGSALNDKEATLNAIIYLSRKQDVYPTKPQAINWLHQPLSPTALQTLSSPASSPSKPQKTLTPLPNFSRPCPLPPSSFIFIHPPSPFPKPAAAEEFANISTSSYPTPRYRQRGGEKENSATILPNTSAQSASTLKLHSALP